MRNITPGLPLFLFNYSDRKLHGIFEAASPGKLNISPTGWTADGSATPYAAQVWDYHTTLSYNCFGGVVVRFLNLLACC